MTETELKKLTLNSAATLIRRKELSAAELIQAVLKRIERLNERMRAFITVTPELALKAGENRPPLQGIPVSVKDLFDTKGIRTTAGSKVFADRIPDEDADVVKKLTDAGGAMVGKTNMHEFAFGVTNVNPHYGAALNPWDPERITGGSSGGSASAVALSLGLGSLGTDTGGSIRIPASACGIVGLKPTYSRVSLKGTIPLSWSLDHAGPMARTVEDATILFGIISGHDCIKALNGEIKDVRCGIPRTYFYDQLDPEVDKIVQTGLRTLERLGARMVEIDLPSASQQQSIFTEIVVPEAYVYHEPLLKKHRDLYGADVRSRIEAGQSMLSVEYVRAQRARLRMQDECKAVFESADVIVTPTLPIPPPRIENLSQTTVASLTRFTRPFNIVGLPAISIPCGFTADGLPIGMQICGRAFDEATVLRVAYAYEQDAKWFECSTKF